MFVSTVRTSYHGLKFAASLRRVNVILSRGSVATFVISNGRVFGRRDLQPDQKHKIDTREGIEALQRLFEWQRRLDNVYTLDTWRKVFGDPISQINTISNDAYKGLTEGESKGKWEKLYYETWRLAILRRWRPILGISCLNQFPRFVPLTSFNAYHSSTFLIQSSSGCLFSL